MCARALSAGKYVNVCATGANQTLLLGAFLPPGNPSTPPNNYGIFIYEQAGGKFSPSEAQMQRFAAQQRHLPRLLEQAFAGIIVGGPVARNWAWLRHV